MSTNPQPDWSDDDHQHGDAGLFWAVPGVERARPDPDYTPGGLGVAGWQPVASPTVDALVETISGVSDPAELLAAAYAVLSRLAEVSVQPSAGADSGMLDTVVGLTRAGNMIEGLKLELVGRVDRLMVCETVLKTRLSTWLGLRTGLTSRQASGLVLAARRAGPYELLRQSMRTGVVSPAQGAAISGALDVFSDELDTSQRADAERVLAGLAETYAADSLSRAGEEVLERVAPELAQVSAEVKAAKALARAERKRFVSIRDLGDGSYRLSGLLPQVEGELVRAVLDKGCERLVREVGQCPGGGGRFGRLDRGKGRADVLVGVCSHAAGCDQAGPLGTNGATVVIKTVADPVGRGVSDPRLGSTGSRVAAGAFGVWGCDPRVVRVSADRQGGLLGVGRAVRLVTGRLRLALVVRDGGCVFPSCDRPAVVCHAHHVKPWNKGGETCLSNTCLLCPTHHRMVEPPGTGDPPWELRLRGDGLWEFIPPVWFDAERRPLLHHRFIVQGAKPSDRAADGD
jgi:hypothetical protein